MRYGHPGLGKMLKKKIKGFKGISPGEHVIFINKDWTALKMFAGSEELLLHLRRPRNKPINPKTIKFLPHCVNGSQINYKKALREVIERDWARKGYSE
jgi:hypothetical protein